MEDRWRGRLTEEEYRVLRLQGTERPHSSPLNQESRPGQYRCKACQTPLFDSASKFNSGCGWPSFDREMPDAHIEQVVDLSHGMVRTEVRCSGCQSHLGHVFPDGPTDTGTRYCINGVCLTFVPRGEE
jgi:peptide-methionine (R)-S-oxide reductase